MIAQKEPSLIQKDLLATKLVGPNLYLLEAEEPCDLARIQLCNAAGPRPIGLDRLALQEAEEPCDLARIQLCDAAGPRPIGPDRSALPEAEELCNLARIQLCNTAEAGSGLLEVGLYNTDIGQLKQGLLYWEALVAEVQLPGTARALGCKTAVFDKPRL